MALQFQRQISRAATQIKRDGIRFFQNVHQVFDRESPPDFVNIDRKQVIEPVIFRCNFGEHGANRAVFARSVEFRVGMRVRGLIWYFC